MILKYNSINIFKIYLIKFLTKNWLINKKNYKILLITIINVTILFSKNVYFLKKNTIFKKLNKKKLKKKCTKYLYYLLYNNNSFTKNKKLFKKLFKKNKIVNKKYTKTNKNQKYIKKITYEYKKNTTNIFKYNYFFTNFFIKFFKKSFFFINFNYFLKTKIKEFKKIVNKVFFKHIFLKKTIYLYKILKIMFASLIYKDSKILIFIIKEMFENIHYSKHRIYFTFWKNLIKNIFSKYYKKLNIFGVRLEFHGKLGVGGNSKKRSVYYSMGRCSNSTKLFKIDSSNSFFKTETGVVGFTYSIFY